MVLACCVLGGLLSSIVSTTTELAKDEVNAAVSIVNWDCHLNSVSRLRSKPHLSL
jgi:hypothetical protein